MQRSHALSLAGLVVVATVAARSSLAHGGHAEHQKAEDALQGLNDILQDKPDDVRALRDRAQLYLYVLDDWESGVADFDRLVGLCGPKFKEIAIANRAVGLAKLGEWKRAWTDVDALCAAGATTPAAWFTRGELRLALGDPAGARADIDKALAFMKWPLAYVRRAEADRALGDATAAFEDYAAALKLDPRHIEALCSRALLHLEKKDEHAAGRDISVAAEAAGPDGNALVQATRARFALARGFKLEAKGAAESAFQLWKCDYDLTKSLNRRAWLLLQMAQLTGEVSGPWQAIDVIDQALAIAPDRPDLHRAKAALLARTTDAKPEVVAAAKKRLAEVEAARVPALTAATSGAGGAAPVASPTPGR